MIAFTICQENNADSNKETTSTTTELIKADISATFTVPNFASEYETVRNRVRSFSTYHLSAVPKIETLEMKLA